MNKIKTILILYLILIQLYTFLFLREVNNSCVVIREWQKKFKDMGGFYQDVPGNICINPYVHVGWPDGNFDDNVKAGDFEYLKKRTMSYDN